MSEPDDRDKKLLALIEELATELRSGHVPDIEKAMHDNDDLADDLRELWGAVLIAEEMGRGSTSGLYNAPTNPAVTVQTAEELPETFGDYEIVREIGRGGMGGSSTKHVRRA